MRQVWGKGRLKNLMSKLEGVKRNHYFNTAKVGVEGDLDLQIL